MSARISTIVLTGFLFVALGGVLEATVAQTSEENKTLVRRLFEEVMNQGNLDVADEILATDYVEHFPPNPDIPGLDAVKQLIIGIRTGFPDVDLTIEDMMAEGDKVAIRATFRGTHLGEFQGIPPTGVSVTLTAIAVRRC